MTNYRVEVKPAGNNGVYASIVSGVEGIRAFVSNTGVKIGIVSIWKTSKPMNPFSPDRVVEI